MSKRMSNKRVKEILEDLNKHEVIMFENTNNEAESEYTNIELHQALDIAIESLDNEWVDVRDRLPSEKEEVLVFTDHKCMYLGSYQKTRYGKIKWYGFKDICEEVELFDEKVVVWKKFEPYERKE